MIEWIKQRMSGLGKLIFISIKGHFLFHCFQILMWTIISTVEKRKKKTKQNDKKWNPIQLLESKEKKERIIPKHWTCCRNWNVDDIYAIVLRQARNKKFCLNIFRTHIHVDIDTYESGRGSAKCTIEKLFIAAAAAASESALKRLLHYKRKKKWTNRQKKLP